MCLTHCTTKKYGLDSLSYHGAQLWNFLPNDMKECKLRLDILKVSVNNWSMNRCVIFECVCNNCFRRMCVRVCTYVHANVYAYVCTYDRTIMKIMCRSIWVTLTASPFMTRRTCAALGRMYPGMEHISDQAEWLLEMVNS